MKDRIKRIKELRALGWSYNRICKELNVSKSIVSYHCGEGVKEKHLSSSKKYLNVNPLVKKLDCFLSHRISNGRPSGKETKIEKIIYSKIKTFSNPKKKAELSMKNSISVQEVLEKIGDNPKCYLTGTPIDLTKSHTYSLDHIIPYSRGGESTLENLGLTTSQANQSKTDMTPEEFIALCRQVVKEADRAS